MKTFYLLLYVWPVSGQKCVSARKEVKENKKPITTPSQEKQEDKEIRLQT